MRFVPRPTLALLITILLAPAHAVVASDQDAARGNPMPYPPIPEAISSFGATVCDGQLYVFGGHMGRVPGSSLDGLSPHFCRLDLARPEAGWQDLPMHRSSQSPGLVTWNGNIYRVGGLSFKNSVDEETSFESLDVFAKYDPQSNTWTELPPLPMPRSSLDAAVVDGRLYVVGGWNLQEGSAREAPWHDTAVMFDLSKEDGAWTTIATPPFSTRALAAATHDHKLYVMGGMNSDNQTTRAVHIYDPKADSWSNGPELAGGDRLAGFAISAFEADGKLYYSGSEGIVYRLADDGASWQSVERLVFPRSFHRLVVNGDRVIVVGGVARGGGYLANIEVVDATPSATAAGPKVVEFSVPFGGAARQGQALYLSGSSLYAFGGNRSRAPHDFSAEAFVNESLRFDLAGRSVERLPDLPRPTQGAAAQLAGERIDQSIWVLGGLGHDGQQFSSVDTIFQYRMRSHAWSEDVGQLPSSRAMFGTAWHEGSLWIFGGSRVNTTDEGLAAETWQWQPGSEEPATIVADANIPTPRRSFGGAVLDGRYYAVGGLGDGGIAEVAEAFDFQSRQWTKVATPRVSRVFPSLAAAGGKLYLAGGFSRIDGHFQPARTIEVYDPAADTWQVAHEALPFAERAGTMMEFQDRLLFYGIDREQDGLAHFVIFDPDPTSTSFGSTPALADERGGRRGMLERLLRLDANKDGALSRDEVGERFRPIIDRADVNQDGIATKEELEAALSAGDGSTGGRERN